MSLSLPVSQETGRRDWARFAGVAMAFAIVFAAAAIPYARRFHVPPQAAAAIYLCFCLLLALALLPGVRAGQQLLARTYRRWQACLAFLVFCIPYLVYSTGTAQFRWMALWRVLVVALVPPIVYLSIPPRRAERFAAGDLAVGVFLIWVVLGGWLHGIWAVPVNLDFMGRLLLIAAVATTWSSVRRVPGLHYRFEFTPRVLRAAIVNFLLFASIAIPLGLLIGFTAWHPRWHGAASFALDYIEIFLFIALLEELFFRGFLQSLLSGSFGSEVRAQVVVSIVFGFFHILHAPFPNWRYVLLASIAGWFYGEAYRRGGTVLASALTHAAVDTIWRTFFTR